jgi:hypothetical protein
MSIVLQGSTSGSITLQEPAIAGSTVLSLPATTGTVALTSQLLASPSAVGQIPFSTDGSTYTATAKIVSGTAVASTSGTSIDFTSIPSWVKRITVMFSEVSTNGSSNIQMQLGDSGGIENTGYLGTGCFVQNASTTGASTSTSGFVVSMNVAAATVIHGVSIITLLNPSTNLWAFASNVSRSDAASVILGSGSKALSNTLDRIRITTVNGTDTFDAGTINILYE